MCIDIYNSASSATFHKKVIIVNCVKNFMLSKFIFKRILLNILIIMHAPFMRSLIEATWNFSTFKN